MQIILLSGGSGKRLWPLSNESRSKQFLRLLPSPDGGRESMVQRVIRQIKESGLSCPVTIATSVFQKDAITNQLGEDVTVVTEAVGIPSLQSVSLPPIWRKQRNATRMKQSLLCHATRIRKSVIFKL